MLRNYATDTIQSRSLSFSIYTQSLIQFRERVYTYAITKA